MAFLFNGHDLIDANPAGERLLGAFRTDNTTISNLAKILEHKFPDLEAQFHGAKLGEHKSVPSSYMAHLHADISKSKDRTLVEIIHDPFILDETVKELTLLDKLNTVEDVMSKIPHMIWQEDFDGKLKWFNRQYSILSGIRQDKAGRPLPKSSRIFPEIPIRKNSESPTVRSQQPLANKKKNETYWFNVDCLNSADGTIYYACDASEEIKAKHAKKTTLSTFVQIFGQLSIGLVVFDKSRQLSIYNPAFCNLTDLNPTFLSSRPTISMLLDQLRNSKRAPEPKSYSVFRGKLSDLEAAANSGRYEETWQLPNNQSIRVTGRPYPEGALVFLFEDVSNNVQTDGDFESNQLLLKKSLDTISDPVFIFTQGNLVFSNAAADQFEHYSPNGTTSLSEMLQGWSSQSAPTAFWSALQNCPKRLGRDKSLEANVAFLNGKSASIQASRIDECSFVLKFEMFTREENELPRVRMRKSA